MRKYQKNPIVLIEDTSHVGWPYPRTGWDLDNRGADGLSSYDGPPVRKLHSVLKDMPTTFKRDITEQFDGIITFEAVYELYEGNGFYMSFANNEAYMLKLVHHDGAFWLDNCKAFDISYGRHYIKFEIDINKGSVNIISDKKKLGLFTVNGTANSISKFVCGFEKEDIGYAGLVYSVKMYKDYYAYDLNINMEEGDILADYIVEKEGRASVKNKKYGPQYLDYSYMLEVRKGSSLKITRPFNKTDGNVIMDMKYLLRDTNGEIKIGLYNADTPAFEILDRGAEIFTVEGALKNHSKDVWQTLRAEIDFSEKTVLIKLNGKKVTMLALADESLENVNNLKIEYKATGDKTAHGSFGEVFVFPKLPEPRDYVPEPVIPEKKGDYYVGMNICSLWRTGDHMGWDCITPYDEIKPLMGYYDEGIPETADWEIKFMAEHGIDFQMYCWYASQSDMPMRSTRLASAIYGGHFNAKYSEKVKFALLWEAANAMHPKGSEAFRKYLVPFWVDYFFSDPRYMRIDNKAVMSVFGGGQLIKDFGSPEGVKKEFDYLRKVVKSLGYDDLIILCCGGADATMKACGFDGAHAYNWGKVGCEVEATKNFIKSNTDMDVYHIVPTVSTGFNNVGWAGTRSPNMSVEGMTESLTWCRDEMLTQYPKNSWKSKFVMLSTWNEYGEGTYIHPTNLNRFGYLDSVRSVFCKDVPHTDVAPSENQKKRINIMHPKDRAKLGRGDREMPALDYSKPYYSIKFETQADLDKWEAYKFTSLEIKDGKLVGHSDEYNPYMIYKEKLPFKTGEISHMIVNIQGYKPVKQVCCTEVYFSNREDKEININVPATLTVPEKIAPLEFQLFKVSSWNGEPTLFRFDPIYGVGDFIVESIDFYKAPDHVEVKLNGKDVNMSVYAEKRNGECYFCFDPKNALANVKELYYEWHKNDMTLKLFGKIDASFTIGKDVAIIDGKELKLKEAVAMFDGLPVIPLSVFAEVIAHRVEEKGNICELIRM